MRQLFYILVTLILVACGSDKEEPLESGVFRENFDLSIRPQDNFYLYVNGSWLKNTRIPDDRTSIGTFYELREKTKEDIKTMIDDLVELREKSMEGKSDAKLYDQTKLKREVKIADLYVSFMDVQQIEELKWKPLDNEFKKIDAIKTKSQMMGYFAESQQLGIDTPLGFYISVDAKKTSRYALHFWQSGLGLPDKSYYFNKEERYRFIRKNYLNHIQNMFALFGDPHPDEKATVMMTFETALAGYHWTRVENRNSVKRYNKLTIKNLSKLAPHISWKRYFKALNLPMNESVIVNQPSYVKGLDRVFQNKPLSDWKIFAKWKLMNAYASLLHEDVAAENFNFYGRELEGQQEQKPRWKRGVMFVNQSIGEIVGRAYVQRYFPEKSKVRMVELVKNLRKSYKESINDLTWMGTKTKRKAQQKLKTMTYKIGYPDRWHDYSKLEFQPQELVQNAMASSRFAYKLQLRKLEKPVQRWEWFMHPQDVNAYYSPKRNEIVFPAAILQPPFFNMAADDAVNYGAIGSIIGHEMGHAFDDQGARFDAYGMLKNWWTKQDQRAFQQKSQNLVSQYNRFQALPNVFVNGELTLGENIADLTGVTVAHEAYEMSLKKGFAKEIDGFTGEQRFFIGFAQIWRKQSTKESIMNRINLDPHSPPEFRTNGVLSNLDSFYKTYGVKQTDDMFLPKEQRVHIW